MIFIHINWASDGGFYLIPLGVQDKVFKEIGRENYIKLPVEGTNPRGVEISRTALLRLTQDEGTSKIDINWEKANIEYHPFKRWIELWSEQ